MIDAMITVYARDFTVDELNAATAYYSSPTGQAFLSKQPMVLREVTQTVLPKLMPMVQKRAADIEAKMQAAVADLPPPPKN